MKIIINSVLIGLAIGIAGCNSHDEKQAKNNGKPATDRAAQQAKGAINTAATTVDRVIDTTAASAQKAANGLDRTAAKIQSDVQQTSYEAAKLTNDLTADPNRIPTDIQRTASDAIKLPSDATKEGNNLINNASQDMNSLKNVLR